MRRFLTLLFIVLTLLLPLSSVWSLPKGSRDGGGKIYYDMAFSYLVQGEREKARNYFRKVLEEKGTYGDLARLELIRMEAEGTGESLKAIRALLEQVEDEKLLPRSYLSAIQNLRAAKKVNEAMELALEFPGRFPADSLTDDVLFISAQIHFEKGAYPASLESLFEIMDRFPEGDQLDDALYLIGKVYLQPGELYSPTRALKAYRRFQENLDRPDFQNSIWKEPVLKKLQELSGFGG